MRAATVIQTWYRRRLELYYMTMRIVARYQLATKVSTKNKLHDHAGPPHTQGKETSTHPRRVQSDTARATKIAVDGPKSL